MRRVLRNILITAALLLVAGVVEAVDFEFPRFIFQKTSGPCFNPDYWDAKYE